MSRSKALTTTLERLMMDLHGGILEYFRIHYSKASIYLNNKDKTLFQL
jgi:hypothetical protein